MIKRIALLVLVFVVPTVALAQTAKSSSAQVAWSKVEFEVT
ncbi:hypothetical protein [Deinococcus pimensis]|nr:hypothetical protein [Deinococcus pimensis]